MSRLVRQGHCGGFNDVCSFTPVSGISAHVSQAILSTSAIGRAIKRGSRFKVKGSVPPLSCLYTTHLLNHSGAQWVEYFSHTEGRTMEYNPVTGETRSATQPTKSNLVETMAFPLRQGPALGLECARESTEQLISEHSASYYAFRTQR